MEFTKQVLKRASLSEYRAFLLNDDDGDVRDYEPYDKALQESCKPIYDRLATIYEKDSINHDNAISDLHDALKAHESVFIEIGMKIGARIISSLL